MNFKKLDRRQLLKNAGLAGGAAGLTALFQNCSNVKMSAAEGDASSSVACVDPGVRTVDPGVTTIVDQPINPAVPGTMDDISATYIEVLHRSQLNSSDSNSQKVLLVAIGPNPMAGNYAPVKFSSANSLSGVEEILVYVPGVKEPVLRRIFNPGDVVPETMFLLDASLVATVNTVTVVSKNASTGFWKKDVALTNPQPYKNFVGTWLPNTPFGTSTFHRPYVAGAGLASGGQGDLGDLHTPLISISGNSMDVSLGVMTTHGRFDENHYVAGCGIYDQNGHPIGPVATIMYGMNYPRFSHAVFSNLALGDRGTTIVRAVIFDTYNGYLMGFLKI